MSDQANTPTGRSGDGALSGGDGGDRVARTSERIRQSLGYQPAFDGIRFFGVTAFIVGHAGLMTNQRLLRPLVWWMAVDMFFVLSGFLITTLLLREMARNGRVSLKAFYVRRVARLYPLIAVALVIAIGQRILRPDSFATPSWWSIISIGFYFTNFQQLTNHADMLNAWGPLWSLSVEEQFYLLWPITLIVLLGRTFQLVPAFVFACAGAAAIVVHRIWRWMTMPETGNHFADVTEAFHVFYHSSFQRPDGIFIGCAAAILLAFPHGRRLGWLIRAIHRVRWVAVAGAVAIITASSVSGNSGWQVCWGLMLFNLLVACIVIELIEYPDNRVARYMSWRPLRWVGRRSYGMYVLHLPVLMILVNVLEIQTLPGILVTVGVIMVVAGVSYRYYEDPIRRLGYRVSRRIEKRDLQRPSLMHPDGPVGSDRETDDRRT